MQLTCRGQFCRSGSNETVTAMPSSTAPAAAPCYTSEGRSTPRLSFRLLAGFLFCPLFNGALYPDDLRGKSTVATTCMNQSINRIRDRNDQRLPQTKARTLTKPGTVVKGSHGICLHSICTLAAQLPCCTCSIMRHDMPQNPVLITQADNLVDIGPAS